jgi:hypothetical protein
VTLGSWSAGSCAEGTAAGGEQDALHVAVAMAFEALEDGVVLAVHGQDVHALALRGLGDGFASHDEDFFAGDGEMHAAFNRRECWSESGGADDGDEDHVGVGFVDEIDEALRPGVQNNIRWQQRPRFGRRGGIGESDLLHAGFTDLLHERFDAAVRGQADDLHALRDVARDFEGAGADGAGGAEEENFAHHKVGLGIVLVLLLELVLDHSGFDALISDLDAANWSLDGSKSRGEAEWQNRGRVGVGGRVGLAYRAIAER